MKYLMKFYIKYMNNFSSCWCCLWNVIIWRNRLEISFKLHAFRDVFDVILIGLCVRVCLNVVSLSGEIIY